MKNKNIPQLRFPEFADCGEWQEKKLKEVCTINPSSSSLPDEFTYIDLESVTDGKLTNPKIIKKINAPSRAQRLVYSNDILYQTVRPYQQNNYYCTDISTDTVASTGYAQLRCKKNNSQFLYQYLHTDFFVGKVILQCTGTNYPAINSTDLSNIGVLIPQVPEQQKIADCLSSLDTLINAQSEKVEKLKSHKKGLLQKLFPQEGQNLPEFRFPEFKDCEEWEEMSIKDISKNLDSKRVPITKSTRIAGNIPYYGASGIIDYVKDYIFNDNLLCISEDGANLIDRVYPIAFSISGKTWVNNHAHVLKFTHLSTQLLVENYINSKSMKEYITGMAQPKLNKENLEKISLFLPKELPEQQKIADCLSSLGELIDKHSQKLELLKAHKKGLMQGLFPCEG